MYNLLEKPILYLRLNNNFTDIYFENIIKIIKNSDFKNLIFDFEEDFNNENFLRKLKEIDMEHSIVFLNKFITNLKCSNIFRFSILNLDNVLEFENFKNLDIVFLYINFKKTENFNWIKLVDIQSTYKNLEFFIEVTGNVVDFNSILNILVNNNIRFSFTTKYKDLEILKTHPCNAYLCYGNNCHSLKSRYPRYLVVNDRGIFPYGCFSERLSFFKNISNLILDDVEKLFIDYAYSQEHSTFLKCNEFIYSNYVITNYGRILPWKILIDDYLKIYR